jgi:hypothetical protein
MYPRAMAPEPETREMQIEQTRREASHRRAADDATDEHEAVSEERRAEKAAYLRDKLDERARSEDA